MRDSPRRAPLLLVTLPKITQRCARVAFVKCVEGAVFYRAGQLFCCLSTSKTYFFIKLSCFVMLVQSPPDSGHGGLVRAHGAGAPGEA